MTVHEDLRDKGFKLIEFLDARITEDAAQIPFRRSAFVEVSTAAAECAAKREILDRYQELELRLAADPRKWADRADEIQKAARAIARVYRDHPDYRDVWDKP